MLGGLGIPAGIIGDILSDTIADFTSGLDGVVADSTVPVLLVR